MTLAGCVNSCAIIVDVVVPVLGGITATMISLSPMMAIVTKQRRHQLAIEALLDKSENGEAPTRKLIPPYPGLLVESRGTDLSLKGASSMESVPCVEVVVTQNTITTPNVGKDVKNSVDLEGKSESVQYFQDAATSGDAVDELNPIPFPLLAANALSWILYGLLIRNYFIYFPNLWSYLLSTYYTSVSLQSTALPDAIKSRKQQNENGQRGKRRTITPSVAVKSIMIAMQTVVFLGAMIVFMLLGTPSNSGDVNTSVQRSVMGYVCVFVLIVFYMSPLSTLVRVLRTKNASSFHFPLSLTILLNCVLWVIYGLIISDSFLIIPNGVGAFLAVLQILCIAIFRKKLDVIVSKATQSVAETPLHLRNFTA